MLWDFGESCESSCSAAQSILGTQFSAIGAVGGMHCSASLNNAVHRLQRIGSLSQSFNPRQPVVHEASFGCIVLRQTGGRHGTNSQFDYIVIGAGSAGCVLAARLSEDPGVRVALLEAGPPDSSVLIHCPAGLALMAKNGAANWAFGTVPQPGLNGRRAYQPCGKVLGGSSSINAMIYIRGQRKDYDAWAAEGNPGWGWDDVLPYFKRAEHNERGADALPRRRTGR